MWFLKNVRPENAAAPASAVHCTFYSILPFLMFLSFYFIFLNVLINVLLLFRNLPASRLHVLMVLCAAP